MDYKQLPNGTNLLLLFTVFGDVTLMEENVIDEPRQSVSTSITCRHTCTLSVFFI